MDAIETVFSPPHKATESEVLRLRERAQEIGIDAWREYEESQTHDTRMTTIYDLYALRGDAEMMEQTRLRIIDKQWSFEIGYHDVVQRP